LDYDATFEGCDVAKLKPLVREWQKGKKQEGKKAW
jgi:hypothetical protein